MPAREVEVVELLGFLRAVKNPPHPTVVHTQTGGEQERKLDVLLIQAAFHVRKGSSFFSDTGSHIGEDVVPAVLELVLVPLSSQNMFFFTKIVKSDNEHPWPGIGVSTRSTRRANAVRSVEGRGRGEKVRAQDLREKVSHERDWVCPFRFLRDSYHADCCA